VAVAVAVAGAGTGARARCRGSQGRCAGAPVKMDLGGIKLQPAQETTDSPRRRRNTARTGRGGQRGPEGAQAETLGQAPGRLFQPATGGMAARHTHSTLDPDAATRTHHRDARQTWPRQAGPR